MRKEEDFERDFVNARTDDARLIFWAIATRRAPATRVSVPGVVTGVTANAVEKLNEKSDGGVSAGDERITGDAEARGSARGGAASASAREGKKTSVKVRPATATATDSCARGAIQKAFCTFFCVERTRGCRVDAKARDAGA